MPEIHLSIERICLNNIEDCPIRGQSAFVRIRPNPDESGDNLVQRAITNAINSAKIWCKPEPCTRCNIGAAGEGIRKGVRFNPDLHRGILISSE